MIRFALFDYIPQRFLNRATFEEIDLHRRILDFKEAVLNNATVLALAHNHPSGNIHPSKFDDTLTQTLKKACDFMRIHFLDHVIICDGFYYSYHERGRL